MRRSTAKKTVTVDGIKFDSLDEAKYYQHLQNLQQLGLVKSFERQVRIELIPALTTFDGLKQRPICYVADFYVQYVSGYNVYVEVKGFANVLDLIKRKLYNYWNSKQDKQVPLEWVSYSKKYGGETGFCSYEYLLQQRKESKRAKTV